MAMRKLLISASGTAAAEMALVLPILLILLFGSVELGKYFMDEHIVVKAVRDGARYAARQPMDRFITSAGGCQTAPLGTVVADTKNIVRTGNLAGTGSRLSYWTNNATITVTVACSATAGGQSMSGIYGGTTYAGAPVGAPVVTVGATVPYTSLFGFYIFESGRSLVATQQAAVMGT
jgi:Flp pilus assembly protein TadG